jgi:hypothetical protein
MKLYDITHEIYDLMLDAEIYAEDHDGEILPEIFDKMENLTIAHSAKIEHTALYIKNQIALVDGIKTEEEDLYKRRKAAEKRVEWLKGYLANNLVTETVETARCKVSLRKSTAVEITDESRLEDSYCNIKTVRTPDKKYIKEVIEAGVEVDGAKMVERKNVIIK